MVTDYDCWHEDHDDVTVESVIATLHQNAATGQAIVREAIAALVELERTCGCGEALASALITAPEVVPEATRQRLAPLVGRYPGFGDRSLAEGALGDRDSGADSGAGGA
jgi:5'-methylthioadenosine phosphorylase